MSSSELVKQMKLLVLGLLPFIIVCSDDVHLHLNFVGDDQNVIRNRMVESQKGENRVLIPSNLSEGSISP